MFLALKEIKHEKLRYGLIIAMIVLISYLIFILTSLAIGLAQQNTQAIESWNIKSIVLNKDSNVSLSSSLISTAEADKMNLTKNQAYIGQAGVVVKAKGKARTSAQFIGLEPNQFLAKQIKLTSGHRPTNAKEIVVDDQLKNNHYKLGSEVTLNSFAGKFKIVGFTHNAKLNVAPVVYGRLSAWTNLRNAGPNFKASAVVSKTAKFNSKSSGLKTYPVQTFINKLPGYSAQNSTFTFMIVFLMIISLIVIAVFLYILTIQKLQNYAVLRAQGIPTHVLVNATISQSLVLVISGLIIGTILTYLTALAIPANAGVPMSFDIPMLTGVGFGIILTGILGSLIPIRTIIKVDPVTVIGG